MYLLLGLVAIPGDDSCFFGSLLPADFSGLEGGFELGLVDPSSLPLPVFFHVDLPTLPRGIEHAFGSTESLLRTGVRSVATKVRSLSQICFRPGLATNSILFCLLFSIKDRCNKVRFQQTHNQGLRQLLLTVSWDLRA